MDAGSGRRPIVLPRREVPVPRSVSPEAQAVLASVRPDAPPSFPDLEDREGWRTMIAERDAQTLALVAGRAQAAEVETVEVGETVAYVVTPDGVPPEDDRVYLDLHGGAFIHGGGQLCRIMGTNTAVQMAARTWVVDYRMPPDHPYPAPLDDCLAAYRVLLDRCDPSRIVVGGSSAGGNLAAATILRARDEGLPLPAGAVLNTPVVDLTESGDSIVTNLGLDPLLPGRLTGATLLYADGHDLRDPYLSPLHADFERGFPPTILATGTRDLLLSDTVLMHRALRRAGVAAELHVFEAAGHGGFLGQAPEDAERLGELRRFADERWAEVDRVRSADAG